MGTGRPIEVQTFTKGRVGPELVLDPALSGPDDNYDIAGQPPMGQPPNIYGSDDLIFVMSLKSPEKADNGITGIATGFFPPPNDFDPFVTSAVEGHEYLFVSGTFSDVVTDVVRITASGANIPTTTVIIPQDPINPTTSGHSP